MPTLSSLWAPRVIKMKTCSAPGDDNFGVMTILGFQCNDTQITWPVIFDNSVLSIIICYLPYSTTVNLLSKCNMNKYFTLQTKLNNIFVNDYNPL